MLRRDVDGLCMLGWSRKLWMQIQAYSCQPELLVCKMIRKTHNVPRKTEVERFIVVLNQFCGVGRCSEQLHSSNATHYCMLKPGCWTGVDGPMATRWGCLVFGGGEWAVSVRGGGVLVPKTMKHGISFRSYRFFCPREIRKGTKRNKIKER